MTIFRRTNSVVALKSGDTLIGNGNEAEYISLRAGTITIIGDYNNVWCSGIRSIEALHVKGNANTISVPCNYLNVRGDACIITANIHRLTVEGERNVCFGKVLKTRRILGRDNDVPQVHVEPPEERTSQILRVNKSSEPQGLSISRGSRTGPIDSPSNINTILRSNGPVGEFDLGDDSLSRHTFRSGSEWVDDEDDDNILAYQAAYSEDSSVGDSDDEDPPPVLPVETKPIAIKIQPRALSQRVSTLARNVRDITHCIARPAVGTKVEPTSDEEETAEKTARRSLSDSDDYESYWPTASSISVTRSGNTTLASYIPNASTSTQVPPHNFGSTSMTSHFEAKKAAVPYAKFTPATPPSRFSPLKPASFTSSNPSGGQSLSTSSTSWASRVSQAPPSPSPSAPAAAVLVEKGFVFPTPTNPKPEEDVVAAVGATKAEICVMCETNRRVMIFYPCRHCISCITCTHKFISVKNKEVRGRKTIPCPICTGAAVEVFAPIYS